MSRWVGGLFVIVSLLGLFGCSAGTPAPTLEPAPEPPAFDLATVKTNFADECKDPIVFDDVFCQQVEIGQMTGEGDILTVPTTLNAAATERAAAICDQIARAHYDSETGKDLGYEIIGILDKDGGNAAACYTR